MIDAQSHLVGVYGPTGENLRSWEAAGLSDPQGIAADGTDIWIVDANEERVYHYEGAAARTTGSLAATSDFALNAENASPAGLITDGAWLWTVGDTADQLFVYDTAGTSLGSWTLDAENAASSGMTNDPAGGTSLGVVDRAHRLAYEFAAATTRLDGTATAAATLALWAANLAPEGIADPPPQSPDGDSLLDNQGEALFTTSEDFQEGEMFNVNVAEVPGQLQLNRPQLIDTFPYIWIPNFNGFLSKIDICAGNEVAHYWTAPPSSAGSASPSRTTVGFDGSCVVGNRGLGTVVKVGHTDFVDCNGNGICDRPTDLNGHGEIASDDMLPFGKDEQLLYVQRHGCRPVRSIRTPSPRRGSASRARNVAGSPATRNTSGR